MTESTYKLTKEEIETDITIDYIDKTAYVYTCHGGTKRKLMKLAAQNPGDVVIDKQDDVSLSVTVPLAWIKIKPPQKRGDLSEESRQQLVERMRSINASRGNQKGVAL